MGHQAKEYGYRLELLAKTDLQIRDNAIEAARQTGSRQLEKKLGKTGYFLRCHIHPHHILRENPLASGAGADRLSTGMAHSYGKPIGRAAQVHKGYVLFSCMVDKANIALAKQALKSCSYKLPCQCQITCVEQKAKKAAAAE